MPPRNLCHAVGRAGPHQGIILGIDSDDIFHFGPLLPSLAIRCQFGATLVPARRLSFSPVQKEGTDQMVCGRSGGINAWVLFSVWGGNHMPPFQSPQTMIREDLVRIVLAGLAG